MRDDAVALHLAEAQAAVARAPLHRLPSQDLHRAAPPAVDLVVHLFRRAARAPLSAADAPRAHTHDQHCHWLPCVDRSLGGTSLKRPLAHLEMPEARRCAIARSASLVPGDRGAATIQVRGGALLVPLPWPSCLVQNSPDPYKQHSAAERRAQKGATFVHAHHMLEAPALCGVLQPSPDPLTNSQRSPEDGCAPRARAHTMCLRRW